MCLGHPCQFIEQWIMFSGCTGTSRTAPIRSQVHINQFLSGAALLLEKCRHWTGGRSRAPVAVLAGGHCSGGWVAGVLLTQQISHFLIRRNNHVNQVMLNCATDTRQRSPTVYTLHVLYSRIPFLPVQHEAVTSCGVGGGHSTGLENNPGRRLVVQTEPSSKPHRSPSRESPIWINEFGVDGGKGSS